jgi:hypothetical protein
MYLRRRHKTNYSPTHELHLPTELRLYHKTDFGLQGLHFGIAWKKKIVD